MEYILKKQISQVNLGLFLHCHLFLNIILKQESIQELLYQTFLSSGSFSTFLNWFKRSSSVKVTNISSFGFWVMIENREYFIPSREYPKFRKLPLHDVFDLKILSSDQLYWEKHDIDIELSALENPSFFPLSYKK